MHEAATAGIASAPPLPCSNCNIKPQRGNLSCAAVQQVRQQLTGGSVPGSKDRSSPYGTPKALRSPMASPLISDPKAMAALDLNPGTTRVVRRRLGL